MNPNKSMFVLFIIFLLQPIFISKICSEDNEWKEMVKWESKIDSLIGMKKYEEAIDLAKHLIDTSEDPIMPTVFLGKVFRAQNRHLALNTHMQDLLDSLSAIENKRRACIEWATIYQDWLTFNMIDIDRFIHTADKCIKYMNNDIQLIEAYSDASTQLYVYHNGKDPCRKKIDKVLEWNLRINKINDNMCWTHKCIGDIYSRDLSDYEQAYIYYEKAFQIESNSDRTKLLLLSWGESCIYDGKYQKAKELLNMALKKKHMAGVDDCVIIGKRGLCEILLNDFNSAQKSIEESIKWAKEKYGDEFKYDYSVRIKNILINRKNSEKQLQKAIDTFVSFSAKNNREKKIIKKSLSSELFRTDKYGGYFFGGILFVAIVLVLFSVFAKNEAVIPRRSGSGK